MEQGNFRELNELKVILPYQIENFEENETLLFFDKILFAVYNLILKRCLSSIPNELINYGDFSLQLLTSQFQFLGNPISSTFAYSLGKSQINLDQNILKLSISKGLPNFATGRYRFCIRESLLAFNSLVLILCAIIFLAFILLEVSKSNDIYILNNISFSINSYVSVL